MYELVNRPEEYISRLRLILSRDPENVFAYGSLISSLENIKQYDEAIELLEKWLKDHPEDREAANRLGSIRAKADSQRADTTSQTLSSGE
jgi:tetratricopeptide (TPR) repeat protein